MNIHFLTDTLQRWQEDDDRDTRQMYIRACSNDTSRNCMLNTHAHTPALQSSSPALQSSRPVHRPLQSTEFIRPLGTGSLGLKVLVTTWMDPNPLFISLSPPPPPALFHLPLLARVQVSRQSAGPGSMFCVLTLQSLVKLMTLHYAYIL